MKVIGRRHNGIIKKKGTTKWKRRKRCPVLDAKRGNSKTYLICSHIIFSYVFTTPSITFFPSIFSYWEFHRFIFYYSWDYVLKYIMHNLLFMNPNWLYQGVVRPTSLAYFTIQSYFSVVFTYTLQLQSWSLEGVHTCIHSIIAFILDKSPNIYSFILSKVHCSNFS